MITPCSVWWVPTTSTVEHVAGQFTPKDYGQYKWEGIQITSWGHTCVAGWLALRAYIGTIINLNMYMNMYMATIPHTHDRLIIE